MDFDFGDCSIEDFNNKKKIKTKKFVHKFCSSEVDKFCSESILYNIRNEEIHTASCYLPLTLLLLQGPTQLIVCLSVCLSRQFLVTEVESRQRAGMDKALENSFASKPFLKGMMVADMNGLCIAAKVSNPCKF